MEFVDHIGHKIQLDKYPKRIVSLVPSQTELLVDLGLSDRLVGITKFCVHPSSLRREKTIVGGTKAVKHDVIEALNPDLIIANKEENERADIERLTAKYPTWTSDIKSLDDACQMIQDIGVLTNTTQAAEALNSEIKSGFEAIPHGSTKVALYLIWKNPYMAAGPDTFIHQMLPFAGFQNVIHDPKARYPELSETEIERLHPTYILLSSEPFPFKGKHTAEVQARFPKSTIMEVDGEMFSWYGSRLKRATTYFTNLLRLAENKRERSKDA